MKETCFIAWLDEIEKEDEALVGAKAANLGELDSLNINIPNGFVVTSNAYSTFFRFNKFGKKIKELLSMLDPRDPGNINSTSEKISHLFIDSAFPFDLAKEIIDAYFKLGSPFKDTFVALRSSTITNSPTSLNQATFLNIQGEANLIDTLKKCWLSLFNPENLFSSQNQKNKLLEYSVAVLTQKMVQPNTSGVIYTQDFLRNKKNTSQIEAIFGLGELATEGFVKPDHYFVNRLKFKILDKEISPQKFELKRQGDLNKKIPIPKSRQKKQKIADKSIIKLTKIGKKIQNYYYFPQEIEWAIEKNKIYILQVKKLNQDFGANKILKKKLRKNYENKKCLCQRNP